MFSDQSPMKVPPPRRDEIVPVSREEDGAGKPKKPPANVRKEFKEVLDGENEAVAEQEFDKAAKKLLGNKLPKNLMKDADKPAMSLFDLSREVSSRKEPPTDIANLAVDENASGSAYTDSDASSFYAESESASLVESDLLAKKDKFNPQFTQQQTDLTFVNPANTQVQSIDASSTMKAGPMGTHVSPIQDIVEKMIDKLVILTTNGQTDTTVTVNAGTFKGTVVVISQFDTANGQLNLSFENLTQQTKLLLDAQPNRDQLMLALSEKGYTVQQMTTTTTLERKPFDLPQADAQFNRPGGREEQRNPDEEQK